MRQAGKLDEHSRKRLDQIRDVLNKMPQRSTGLHTQSQTIDNLVAGAIDSDGLMKALSGLLYSLLIEYQTNKDEDFAYCDPDLTLAAMTQWVEQREKERWARSETRIDRFLEKAESQYENVLQH